MSDGGNDELDDGIERENQPDPTSSADEIPIVTMEADTPPDDLSDEPPQPAFEFPDLGRAPDVEPPSQTIIAVGSGRGGVGKSLLAANIAVYLAQVGKRIVAIDG